jgi:hypothetical protein
MLLRAALFFEALTVSTYFPPAGKWPLIVFGGLYPQRIGQLWGLHPQNIVHLPSGRIKASLRPVLFIKCNLRGFSRQIPILIQPGGKKISSHSGQPTVLRGDISLLNSSSERPVKMMAGR